MKLLALLAGLYCALSVVAAAPKSILLIAGTPSHGAGEHEFYDAAKILANALDESGFNIKTMIHHDTWPERAALDKVDVLVLHCDGEDKHVALGHEGELLALKEKGVGMVVLHYAVDGSVGMLNETLMKLIGGCYVKGKSFNPVWTMEDPIIEPHSVTRGVNPFELKEEWYYDLQFGDVVPLFKAVPPEEDKAHTLAWTFGDNAFGFTGGHFLNSWAQPDYRKLVLNAIIWSAGLEVPDDGVESADPVVAKNKSMLHAIAKGDPVDVRNHLLLGADVNEKNKQGWTPLHFATVRGKLECALVLMENGAALNPRTGTEKTPLHFAGERGFLEIIKALVESGADMGAQDDEGWSPLHYAAEKDHVDVAAYLIAEGAVVDLQSVRGGTPLHEASASASPGMITLLLTSGADRSITATNGYTPLDYAVELENKPAEVLLR
ncbi:MAG: ankyrin repeat domain-containing protein [Pontiella sp.]